VVDKVRTANVLRYSGMATNTRLSQA